MVTAVAQAGSVTVVPVARVSSVEMVVPVDGVVCSSVTEATAARVG